MLCTHVTMVCVSQITTWQESVLSFRQVEQGRYSLTFLFRITLVFLAGLKDKLVHFFKGVNKAVFLTAEVQKTLTCTGVANKPL